MYLRLNNYGNNCYFNASIQALLSCKNILNILFTDREHNNFFDELKKIALIKYSKKDSSSTIHLHKHIIKANRNFMIGSQEDAHELLVILFELLKNKPMDLLLNTKYKHDDSCVSCNYTSNTNENMNIISIPVVQNTLMKNLRLFFESENITKTCEKCEKTPHKRSIVLNKIVFADTLIIQLKRFDAMLRKNTKPVFFPMNFTIYENKYTLRSIIVHLGGFGAGHYLTFSYLMNKWIIFNDNFNGDIKDIALHHKTLYQNGYIFFYEKVK